VTRDVKTHFGDDRTGQSTARRSFAALLHGTLGLRDIPRNTAKPGYLSNYGLSTAHDAALTRWMREHLQLAVWSKSIECEFTLGQVETALVELLPPLTLQRVVTPWTAQVKSSASGDGRGGASLGGPTTRRCDVSVHDEVAKLLNSRGRIEEGVTEEPEADIANLRSAVQELQATVI
jgi:hypothetical protein